MAREVAAAHPDSVCLEILSPESDQARGLDTRKSISIYVNRERIPIRTGLSRPDLENRILTLLSPQPDRELRS